MKKDPAIEKIGEGIKVKRHVILGAMLLCGAVIFGIWWTIFYRWLLNSWLKGREINSTLFCVGGIVAVVVIMWPIHKYLSGWRADVARALTITVCLTPVPFGPEANMVPMGLLLPFALLVPQGPLIIFGGTFCLSSGLRILFGTKQLK